MKPGHLTPISRGKEAGPEQRVGGRDMFRGRELPLGSGREPEAERPRERQRQKEKQRGRGAERQRGRGRLGRLIYT